MPRSYLSSEEKSLLKSRETIAWGQLALCVAFVLLAFASCSNSRSFSALKSQKLTTVQLCDGRSLYASQKFGLDREEVVIKNFAMEWTSLMWSWHGKNPGTQNKDVGVKTTTGATVPINSWAASLMMNPNYAELFLDQLSKITPKGVYSGQISGAVKIRYVSPPRLVKPGIWDVDLISERIIFDKHNNQQLKPVPFNKTLRIRAITISHSPLKENANPLEKTLYSMSAAGLEIETVLDYKD